MGCDHNPNTFFPVGTTTVTCTGFGSPQNGTASFTMEPSHYASVKEELADIRQAS